MLESENKETFLLLSAWSLRHPAHLMLPRSIVPDLGGIHRIQSIVLIVSSLLVSYSNLSLPIVLFILSTLSSFIFPQERILLCRILRLRRVASATNFPSAAVRSCPEGFLFHRGFHRNFLWNKNKIESRIRNDQIHFRILLSIFIISVYTVLLFLMQAITWLLQNKKNFNHLKSFFMPQTGIEPVLD